MAVSIIEVAEVMAPEVPECSDERWLQWVEDTATFVRTQVGDSPCIRFLPYRREMVGIDFFERCGCQGHSVEISILTTGQENLAVQQTDLIRVYTRDRQDAFLLSSLLASRFVRAESQFVLIP